MKAVPIVLDAFRVRPTYESIHALHARIHSSRESIGDIEAAAWEDLIFCLHLYIETWSCAVRREDGGYSRRLYVELGRVTLHRIGHLLSLGEEEKARALIDLLSALRSAWEVGGNEPSFDAPAAVEDQRRPR